jgi:hypothetical protein
MYCFFFSPKAATPGTRRFHLLYGDEQVLARSETEEDLLEEFERDLGRHLSEASPTRFFVHAGVVGWKGMAILMPGRTFTGKTTLVKEFLKHGATYYSDEFAVLDADGRVHPFAKPLGLRTENDDRQRALPVSSLAWKIGTKSAPIGLILLTRFKPRSRWRPRSVSGGSCVLELLANAFSARANPQKAITVLCKAAAGARVLRGVRGEAKDLVRAVLEESASQSWKVHGVPDEN